MLLGELIGDSEPIEAAWRGVDVGGLTSDSRQVRGGFLFAALSGSRFDGSRFIGDACRRGAAAIVVSSQVTLPRGLGIPVIRSDNPRRLLALMAARFHAAQPDIVAAVTGTNGKTSVVSFLRQIWQSAGYRAASLGTIGLVTPDHVVDVHMTTPEPVELHQLMSLLSQEKISHLAIEASSHGLSQHRIDGVRIFAAAFTNISRDHLDYHDSFEDYLLQKTRLFSELLDETGVAVVDADSAHAEDFIRIAERRGIRLLTVGKAGQSLALMKNRRNGMGHIFDLRDSEGRVHHVEFPLVGDFQISNALVAAGLAIGCGMEPTRVLAALGKLKGVPGRLEMVGEAFEGTSVFVDYAHTPDALRMVLLTLRPYVKRRLIVVFGAGGERDRGKRPDMGKIAGEYADIVIVTDDNPRGEDPGVVRSEILAAIPDAIEIGDRRTAIAAGVKMLRAGDILLIAGKGHETGQEIGHVVVPFSDHEAVHSAIMEVRRRA